MDDDDSASIVKNKQRKKAEKAKKDKDKWSQLYFYNRDALEKKPPGTSASGRSLKREGFNIFNRLTCKDCGKTFHKVKMNIIVFF